jgi:hypothetical protein
MNGRAAFAPDAITFIHSLPDNGKLSIKTTRSTDGKVKEANFSLGAVSEVKNKIAKACDWDNAPVDEIISLTGRLAEATFTNLSTSALRGMAWSRCR